MFAALTIPRLIEAVHAASTPEFDLHSKPSWRSPDDVPAEELPLAKACQKVLASMQAILTKTTETCQKKMSAYDARAAKDGRGEGGEADEEISKKRHLALTNASEVTVPRYVKELLDPPDLERFRPRAVRDGESVPNEVGQKEPDELDVPVGTEDGGAMQVLQEGTQGKIVGEEKKEGDAS
jgi:pyridoxine kinase